MPSVDEIRRALRSRSPAAIPAGDHRQAAVAMVLHPDPDGTRVLFIERARRAGDPWSGHMAFPGGRVDPVDAGPRAAAERETLEEVGLSLDEAELLGRLDDKKGNPRTHPTLVISAFVYAIGAPPPPLAPNHEVEHAFWFRLRDLADPANHVPYLAHGELEFPGILVGEPERHVVWGLTYSFLESFFDVLGQPLPDRWTPAMRQHARPVRMR